MPEANQYVFDHKEILAMLIREAGIKEGRWILQMHFNFTAGNIDVGPQTPGAPVVPSGKVNPGAIVAVQNIGILRAGVDAPEALVMDAADAYKGKS